MFERITAVKLDVVLLAESPMRLPRHKGSTLRGVLGHALRQVACALRAQRCDTCLLRHRCAYSTCFETPIQENADMMRLYTHAPHPFVLEPDLSERTEYQPGDALRTGVWLVGRAVEHTGHFIYAFEEAGRLGLGLDMDQGLGPAPEGSAKGERPHGGPKRGRMRLGEVSGMIHGETRAVYDPETQHFSGMPDAVGMREITARAEQLAEAPLKIAFLTPARVKRDGSLSSELTMGLLARTLLRRLTQLEYFHCGNVAGEKDVAPMLKMADGVAARSASLHWEDRVRYSGRQGTKMQMGGVTGEMVFDPVPLPLLECLCWGELLHVGKGTSFGLGQYILERA